MNSSASHASHSGVESFKISEEAIQNGRFLVETYPVLDPSKLEEPPGAQHEMLYYGKLVNPKRPATDKALLFVPGLGGTVRFALAFLDAMLPHYSCIYAPDLRGYGLNYREAPLDSLKPIIRDLESFHQAILNPSSHQALDLCGISLGGILATMLASQWRFYKEDYKRLALLVPAFKASPVKFTPAYVFRQITQRYLLGNKYTRLPYGIDSLTQNTRFLEGEEKYGGDPLRFSVDYLLEVRSLGLKAMKQVKRLEIPTLMAIADKDVVCDPKTMRRAYRHLPESLDKKLLEYPTLYHDILMEEEAPEIGEAVGSWLNR